MLFVTVFFTLYLLHNSRSVKVLIDGTIDFGPKWNFEYKVNPIQRYEPRKKISRIADKLEDSEHSSDADINGKESKGTVEADINGNGNIGRTSINENYNKELLSEEADLEVTKLYKTHKSVTNEPLFKSPSKIEDDNELMSFITSLYNQTLEIFTIGLKESIAPKIIEIKERYLSNFGKFLNETKEYHIKTTLGRKKVIIHTIEYSDRFLNRLGKRLRIDLEDSGLKNSNAVAKRFKTKIDDLKTVHYENACKQFEICRIGNEFSDYINDLLTILMNKDNGKIYSAVDAMTKVLKNTDFSKIMDTETQQAFKRRLSAIEESSSLDRRLLLTAYKIVIESRHFPFFEYNQEPSIKPLAALLHVIEVFNKNIKMTHEKESWGNIKKDLQEWTGEEINVTKISQQLVNTMQKEIDKFDDNTLNDIKSKLRIYMLAKNEWINLNRYMLFHEDI